MNIKHELTVIGKLGLGLTAFTLLLAGCGGGGSTNSAADGGGVTAKGIATPSKVSVVSTKQTP